MMTQKQIRNAAEYYRFYGMDPEDMALDGYSDEDIQKVKEELLELTKPNLKERIRELKKENRLDDLFQMELGECDELDFEAEARYLKKRIQEAKALGEERAATLLSIGLYDLTEAEKEIAERWRRWMHGVA